MKLFSRSIAQATGLSLCIMLSDLAASAQTAASKQTLPTDGYFFPVLLFSVALTSFGAAYFFWKKSKRAIEVPRYNYGKQSKGYSKSDSFGGVDATKEMEWLRKAKKSNGSLPAIRAKGRVSSEVLSAKKSTPEAPELDFDTKTFQEKMRRLQYAQLPINSFTELRRAGLYEPLPISDDVAVLDAIEQVNDEYEADEAFRDLALRILTAFRTRNSVEAVSQIALYDLSSNLRSRAVSTLTDFDHESVFEAILLACADPTREVRAAAARGLFKLHFDRADAWKRIIETNDEFRMSHAARAALEAGIVVKSFDRLVHEDRKVAYEAFCLVSLLICSGETDAIFNAIRTHKDERVRFALLHVITVIKDPRTIDELNKLSLDPSLATDVADRVRAAVERFEMVAS
jgi:hypothetical protein